MIKNIIKFVGTNKADSILKALKYYHSHLQEGGLNVEDFLAKCRIQKDNLTIHYYPDLEIKLYEKHKNNNFFTKIFRKILK